jgi:hypothetical protein
MQHICRLLIDAYDILSHLLSLTKIEHLPQTVNGAADRQKEPLNNLTICFSIYGPNFN